MESGYFVHFYLLQVEKSLHRQSKKIDQAHIFLTSISMDLTDDVLNMTNGLVQLGDGLVEASLLDTFATFWARPGRRVKTSLSEGRM